jgi:hypothetical protein
MPDAEAGPDGAGDGGAMPADAAADADADPDVGDVFGADAVAPTGWAGEPPHPVRPTSIMTVRARTAGLAEPGTHDITATVPADTRPTGGSAECGRIHRRA